MKFNLKINSYLKNLIKENILFFLLFIILFIFTLTISFINFPKLNELDAKINQNKLEITDIKNQITFLDENVDENELDFYLNIITNLIPYREDYFSIIYALETLSKKTGFLITSYQINLTNSTQNKLKLIVSGVGDKQIFLEFLKNYNFAGGRLITADEITLTEDETSEIKINLTFYNYPANQKFVKITLERFKNDFDTFKKIISKIQLNIAGQKEENNEIKLEYPKKQNPF